MVTHSLLLLCQLFLCFFLSFLLGLAPTSRGCSSGRNRIVYILQPEVNKGTQNLEGTEGIEMARRCCINKSYSWFGVVTLGFHHLSNKLNSLVANIK